MSEKVVILHGSPRVSGNSDILAKEFKKGSEDAGNEVKKISFPMRFVNYCKGCLSCVSSGECVIHDGILEDLNLEKTFNFTVIDFTIFHSFF